MTSLIHLSPLLKCLMTVCPSSLHSCVQGFNFSPSGEIMSFGVSPVNYSDSDSDSTDEMSDDCVSNFASLVRSCD